MNFSKERNVTSDVNYDVTQSKHVLKTMMYHCFYAMKAFMIIIMMHFCKFLKIPKLEDNISMKTMFINAEN
jgi:hypothetical protein